MFELEYSKQATNFLKRADKILTRRLVKKLEELRMDPVPHDAKVIHGYQEKLFRVRVGDYRVLYEVDYPANVIGIVVIDKRSKVYEE